MFPGSWLLIQVIETKAHRDCKYSQCDFSQSQVIVQIRRKYTVNVTLGHVWRYSDPDYCLGLLLWDSKGIWLLPSRGGSWLWLTGLDYVSLFSLKMCLPMIHLILNFVICLPNFDRNKMRNRGFSLKTLLRGHSLFILLNRSSKLVLVGLALLPYTQGIGEYIWIETKRVIKRNEKYMFRVGCVPNLVQVGELDCWEHS